jgi:aldose 1-epimerase
MNTHSRAAAFIITIGLLLSTCPHGAEAKGPSVREEPFGKTADGEQVEIFTLTNSHGLKARITTWGACLVSMEVPDRKGALADVALGFDNLEPYMKRHPYFGATTGRYANRIAKGKFTIDGKEFTVATNNGVNHLHGGIKGFDQRNWKGEADAAANAVRFSYTSADGEEGYPGTLKTTVTYTLTENDELRIDYGATTDKPTIVNLTNHSYWNLAGAGEGDVLGHELVLHASKFTPVDEGSIPTGELKPVAGGPMDFTKAKTIGKDFAQMAGTPGGYDHNYIIDRPKPGALTLAAEVYEPKSGRVMKISTTEPGIQFYTGNNLNGTVTGKGGKPYQKAFGFCLETQHYPDSPNRPDFPSTVLRPGQVYRSTTIHQFSAK